MKILYLSHGAQETGGYKLEHTLASAIGEFREIRFSKNYRGLFHWILLFFKAFSHPKADVIITVSRLAWPVYLRNMFNRSEIILVVHNYDPDDKKRALYYYLLNSFLHRASGKSKKINIVVVSHYWFEYFKDHWNFKDNLFVFPNLFDNAFYVDFKVAKEHKNKKIHFGQFSSKIDRNSYLELQTKLFQQGYTCYFSSIVPISDSDFEIICFPVFSNYLKAMAESIATIICNQVKEGWNRVAHESFLVGTTVFANGGGGLTELVSLANGYVNLEMDSIVQTIIQSEFKNINTLFLDQLDLNHASEFVKPLKNRIIRNA
ncbi:MAG: hypothetical protein KG003_14355 [Bacteroidetes bacterium]|nr:hypothetical protein [Bacteroidota bacterium]